MIYIKHTGKTEVGMITTLKEGGLGENIKYINMSTI